MAESDDDQAGVPLIEDFSDSADSRQQLGSKRKRTEDVVERAESKRAAKRKKRKDKKPRDVDDDALDLEAGVNHAIAHMDSRLLADHMAQRTRRFQPDLSIVEAEDCHIPDQAITDTTSWSKSRITDELPDFLAHFAAGKRKKKAWNLSEAPKDKGAPHTIVVAGAGLRAADLTRVLRRFQTKDTMVAKLFAKHIKLKEAIETVKSTRMNIGIGTPRRLIDLLNDGALSSTHLERIVIDASHIDQKKRGLLDMKETQVPLVQLLTRSDLMSRYSAVEGKVELLFY